jgi:ankyrin repeat protein
MVAGQADIFVEMEEFDQIPADSGRGDQVLQKFYLRKASGGGYAGFSAGGDGGSDERGGVLRGGFRSLVWTVEKAQSNQNVMIARVGRIARGIVIGLSLAGAVWAQSVAEVRKAAVKALPVLERSAAVFVEQRACVSCHHNILPIMMLHMAEGRGLAVDSAVLHAVEEKTFGSVSGPAALDDAVQAVTVNDPTPDDSFLLMAAHAAGRPADLTMAVIARRLTKWQREGHWVTSDFRPPHSSSLFTATATAVRAIRLYMPDELREKRDASVQEARRWLLATRPASTEDAAFRLMGLGWAGANAGEVGAARADLIAMQKPDGGWPQTPAYPSDAYSTGEALYALHETSESTGEAASRKALKFLLSTQAADGTWHVRTRMLSPASVSPKYFTTGFPYQKDEYLSYAGSCWALVALLTAMQPRAPEAPAQQPAFQPVVQEANSVAPVSDGRLPVWVRTALFGTAAQLRALLDGGLDPNTKTERGTTLLMMAVPDAEKVRVLVAHGVEVKARAGSASGADALTIACAYRGAAPAAEILLNAGADLKPPEGKRVRSSPLVFASMTGDLDMVKLLLAHGADPSAATQSNTPISAAVTFGYPGVAQALIAAGASVGMRESTGINLLHWATITDRPALIPLLAKAGVPLNEPDDFGFTPLMYAATIDFGGAELVKALRQAGADPNIRNDQGRTAIEQAHFLRHAALEAALR